MIYSSIGSFVFMLHFFNTHFTRLFLLMLKKADFSPSGSGNPVAASLRYFHIVAIPASQATLYTSFKMLLISASLTTRTPITAYDPKRTPLGARCRVSRPAH